MKLKNPSGPILLVLILTIVSVHGQSPPETEAVLTETKPTLDAVVSPGEWDAAPPTLIEHVLRSAESAKPAPMYQFRLMWDDEALYMLFETNLTSWPGGTGGFGANNNINFYIDPNNDDEENGDGGGQFDGYHPVIYPDTGKTSRFDRPFDVGVRSVFHEASINADFGGSNWPASSSNEEGVGIDYVSKVGPEGGIIELCFPWKLFDSEAGTDLEIFHPDPPEIGDTWFLNVCIISALGDLPTWSWTSAQIFAARPHGVVNFTGKLPRVPITEISRDLDAGTFSISWESKGGLRYNLRSEADLANGEPTTWPIFAGGQDIVATPPINTLSFPIPADDQRFFVLEEFPAPPVTIYTEDFESGQGDWTTGSEGAAETEWELGSPSEVGPAAANSPTNCFGTNLSANYGLNADIWLRSPPVDLTAAGGATLHYFQFTDMETGFDVGQVAVLNAADNVELAVLDSSVEALSDWSQESLKVPEEALGKTVVFEFRFRSDELEVFPGWYVDDVSVSVP